MKKANAQLALFYYLLRPWGAHTQCLQPCVAWLCIALPMGSLGSTKSSGHILASFNFLPSRSVGWVCSRVWWLHTALELGSGDGLSAPTPSPAQTFPCSPAALVSICYRAFWCDCFLICWAECNAEGPDTALTWGINGLWFWRKWLAFLFSFFLRNLACNTCTSNILKNFVRCIFISL